MSETETAPPMAEEPDRTISTDANVSISVSNTSTSAMEI